MHVYHKACLCLVLFLFRRILYLALLQTKSVNVSQGHIPVRVPTWPLALYPSSLHRNILLRSASGDGGCCPCWFCCHWLSVALIWSSWAKKVSRGSVWLLCEKRLYSVSLLHLCSLTVATQLWRRLPTEAETSLKPRYKSGKCGPDRVLGKWVIDMEIWREMFQEEWSEKRDDMVLSERFGPKRVLGEWVTDMEI